jgi:hypothetical protein
MSDVLNKGDNNIVNDIVREAGDVVSVKDVPSTAKDGGHTMNKTNTNKFTDHIRMMKMMKGSGRKGVIGMLPMSRPPPVVPSLLRRMPSSSQGTTSCLSSVGTAMGPSLDAVSAALTASALAVVNGDLSGSITTATTTKTEKKTSCVASALAIVNGDLSTKTEKKTSFATSALEIVEGNLSDTTSSQMEEESTPTPAEDQNGASDPLPPPEEKGKDVSAFSVVDMDTEEEEDNHAVLAVDMTDYLDNVIGGLLSNGNEDPTKNILHNIDVQEADTVRARLLNRLPAKDREQVLLDVHAVPDDKFLCPVPEWKDKNAFVQESLKELHEQLDEKDGFTSSMTDNNGNAVQEAEESCPLRSEDDEEMAKSTNNTVPKTCTFESDLLNTSGASPLMFLRKERFNVQNAMKRIEEHLEEKRNLFGNNNVLTKDDLDDGTKSCLESGIIRMLPNRDRAGRAVIVSPKNLFVTDGGSFTNETIILRAIWFLVAELVRSQGNEPTGLVFVIHNALGEGISLNDDDELFNRVRRIGAVLHALPFRTVAVHWCVDTNQKKLDAYRSSLAFLASAGSSSKDFVARIRCHSGGIGEILRELVSFGVPIVEEELGLPIPRTTPSEVEASMMTKSQEGEIKVVALRSHQDNEFRPGGADDKVEGPDALISALALVEAPIIFEDGDDPFVDSNFDTNNDNRSDFPKVHYLNQENDVRINDKHLENFTGGNGVYQQLRQQVQNNYVTNNVSKTSNFGQDNDNTTFDDMFYENFECNYDDIFPMQVSSIKERNQVDDLLLQADCVGRMVGAMAKQPHMYAEQQHGTLRAQQKIQPKPQSASSMDNNSIPFNDEPVFVPGEMDILLGRGRRAQNHRGNVHYRKVVELFRKRYEMISEKSGKTTFIRDVVDLIYNNGGRFLKRSDESDEKRCGVTGGCWIPVRPEVAREKVSHSFRNQKRLSLIGSAKQRKTLKQNGCVNPAA